jgi:hypothetical protein
MSKEFLDSLDTRRFVLMLSIPFENQISTVLEYLLDLDSDNESFSNKSGNIPLELRLKLLYDLKALDKRVDKPKIQQFVAIRNQFVHNENANSFVDCAKFLDGMEGYLRKNYKFDEKKTTEENLKNTYFSLAADCSKISMKLFSIVLNKVQERTSLNLDAVMARAYNEAIEKLSKNAEETETPDLISVRELHSTFIDLYKTYSKEYKDKAIQKFD